MMAMTLEQKVFKKAKPFRNENLKYKKGLAILILSLNEEAVEYSSETEYLVRLYFKSKAAIKRVSDTLGKIKFDKKRITANFELGRNFIELNLSSYELFSLEAGFNIYKKMGLNYRDHYSDFHFSVQLDPTKSLNEDEKQYRIGSTAGGKSLDSYFQSIKESILSGSYNYLV